MTGSPRDSSARDRFVRNGFVVLRDAVPESTLAAARRAVAETVPEDLTATAELVDGPEDRHYWNDLDDMEPFGALNERTHELAEELVGEGRLQSPGEFTQVALRYPTGESASDPVHETTPADGNAHVDVFDEAGDLRPFIVCATTYLDNVYPRGGGLTVWPGTHRRVADRCVGRDSDGLEPDAVVERVLERDAQPFEVTGPAGTVVLWHSLLVHTGGRHLGSVPQVAAFIRFRHRDRDDVWPGALGNPFEHWDVGES
jgi:hypothetical protein